MTYQPANYTEEKALILLGANHPQESVAAALGISPSRISQLMANEAFANEVASRRFATLQNQTVRDTKLDELEDKVLSKLEKHLPLINKPMDLVKVYQTLNAAKRRGAPSDNNSGPINQTVINLTLPSSIVNKYRTNTESRVIEINDKPFVTAPNSMLEDRLREKEENNEHAIKAIKDSRSVAFIEDQIREITSAKEGNNFKANRVRSPVCAEDL